MATDIEIAAREVTTLRRPYSRRLKLHEQHREV
jgi:hypothetical protein